MEKGGFSLLIATVAMLAYFLILRFSNWYFSEHVKEISLSVTTTGELSIDYEKTKEEIYIYWETDGGNLVPVEKNDKFKEVYESQGNHYIAYTQATEAVKWNPEDADGNRYTTATIRAVVYKKEDGKNNYYISENGHIKELLITITNINGKIVKTEERYFSNPVRESAGEDWVQIYEIEKPTDNTYNLRYRTGKNLKEESNITYVLCWQSEKNILGETDLLSGPMPHYQALKEKKNEKILRATFGITVDASQIETEKIEAYLVESSIYEKESFTEEEKKYKATIDVKKVSE